MNAVIYKNVRTFKADVCFPKMHSAVYGCDRVIRRAEYRRVHS